MNIVFLMDPLEGVIPAKDTSFALMLGAQTRGHTVFFLPNGGITLRESGITLHVEEIVAQDNAPDPFVRKGARTLGESEVDIVLVRNDPPFDEQYLLNTWLLDRLPSRVVVLNRPAGIRSANEKLWATQFAELIPRTVVSRQMNDFRVFIDDVQDVVAKPTDGFGGQSVFRLRRGDTNVDVTLETLSANGTREIVVQEYVPAAHDGDKRILLLNGEILGAVLRVHSETDHRNNFFSGGQPHPTTLTDRDREICDAVAPALREQGLYFVGLDVIGDKLIEINVTSPTCLREMDQLYGESLGEKVIEFAESLCGKKG